MRSQVIAILTLVALLVPTPPARADSKEEKEQVGTFEEQMKTADEAGKVRLINEFVKSGNPGASKAISRYLSARSTAVKVAAIKAVGSLKEKKFYGRFLGMIKSSDKNPKVLAAVLEAVGHYGNKGSMKPLVKAAKKWLFKDWEVASAAAVALGHIIDKSAVEELIKLMDMTFPRQSASGPSISGATRDMLAKSRPAIIHALQILTGCDFQDAAAWKFYWEKAQRGWKPAEANPDLTKLSTWRDPGYRFEITRPSTGWEMVRGKDMGEDYERYRIIFTKNSEEVTQAYVRVDASENTRGDTPRQKSDYYKKTAEESFKNIKAETWKEGTVKIGKETGFFHSYTGMDSRGNVCRIRNLFVVKGPMIFVVEGWHRTGMKQEWKDELQKLLDSFELFD